MSYAILSVPLPVEVKREMDSRPEIKWVEVARQAILSRLRILERLDELLAASEFTDADALKHGRIVKKKAWAHRKHHGGAPIASGT